MSSQSLNLTSDVRNYLLSVGVREAPSLQALRQETAELAQGRMQICPEQGALMAMVVKLMGARQILEVGTFTGYSSLAMALASTEAHVTCCDHSEEWTDMARRYWKRAGVDARMDLRIGPALDTLDALITEGRSGTFDLSFVDADKENYRAYHERCLTLVRAGGALLYDNVLWSGSVADPADERPSTVALRDLNQFLAQDERVDLAMVPIGDGLTIAVKR